MFGFEEVFQNRVLSLLFLRPPRHRVTCDLIPLAVLKHRPHQPLLHLQWGHMWSHTACGIETQSTSPQGVSCILRHMWSHTACGIETSILCIEYIIELRSHVISYRLRYWNSANFSAETKDILGSHVISYRLRYWNPTVHRPLSIPILVTCDLIPLAVLKRSRSFTWTNMHYCVTCDLIPLAVLKRRRVRSPGRDALVTCDLIPLAVLKPGIS